MNAQQANSMTDEQLACYAEAKRLARERGITDPLRCEGIFRAMCFTAYLRACEPFVNQAAHIESLRVPIIRLQRAGAGPVQIEYSPRTPEAQEAMDMIREAIASLATRYGLEVIKAATESGSANVRG